MDAASKTGVDDVRDFIEFSIDSDLLSNILFIASEENWYSKGYSSIHYIEEKVKVKYRYM